MKYAAHILHEVNHNGRTTTEATLPKTLDRSSSRVKDTLSHTSMPAFSVDSELLRYFPGYADAFQMLYGVYPALSWYSRLSLCTAYIPVDRSHKCIIFRPLQ